MRSGFVILNFNSWKLTKFLAEKVSSFHNIDRVIIVDNLSTDDSYEHLKELHSDNIEVILSDKNGGYSYGNNLGAWHCKEQYIDILFIANPDVDIQEEDISKILEGFKNSDYSILSGVEYDINGRMSEPPLWKQMTYKDDLIDCFFLGRKFVNNKKGIQLKKNLKIQSAEIVKGSFFGIRLEEFLDLGGFDEEVFLFCEERILAHKLINTGRKIGIVTGAKYFHNHSAAINKTYKAVSSQIKILYKSRMYYNKHYLQIGRLKRILLKSAMEISILEYKLLDLVKAIRSRTE